MDSERLGPLFLTGIAHGGMSIARHEGRVLFVRGGIPGESVIVRVTDRSHASYWRAEVVEVLEASVHRVEPRCPLAGRCGGCDFQHIDLSHQRTLKSEVVREQLVRLAGIESSVDVEGVDSDNGYGWRTRMRYHTSEGRIGLKGSRSHDVIELPQQGCCIADPSIAAVHDYAHTGDQIIAAVDDKGTHILNDKGEYLEGDPYCSHRISGRNYRVAVDGFWQVHNRAAQLLSDRVGELIDVESGSRALDLYCGVGLLSGVLVDAGMKVTGIELSRRAIAYARRNVPEARFISADLRRRPDLIKEKADLIVLDPPRAGAGKKVVAAINSSQAKQVIYISCDPASLGRDLGLLRAGGFTIDHVEGHDLFPMTSHVETVCLMTRKER